MEDIAAQFLFCEFCDFCVTIIFHAEGTFLSHTENTENTEIISFEHGWDGSYGLFLSHIEKLGKTEKSFLLMTDRQVCFNLD